MTTARVPVPPPPPSPAAAAPLPVDHETLRAGMIEAGRAAMGVTGTKAPPLRRALREHGASWYPLLALSILVMVDEFQRTAFTVMGPDIARALGISPSAVGALLILNFLAVSMASLPIAALVQRKPRRALVAQVTAFGWSITTICSGFVSGLAGFLGLMAVDGATTGSVQAVHAPLLFDHYPPATRARVLSFYRGADFVGRVVAPAVVAVSTGLFLLSWRGVFVVMGLISTCAALIALRLRDPGFGRFDSAKVRQAVHHAAGDAVPAPRTDDVALGFWEINRRLWLIPTIRRLFQAYVLLGMMLVPMLTFLPFLLEDRFGLNATGRGIFSATTPILALFVLGAAAKKVEDLFARDPALVMRFTAMMFAAALASLLVGLAVPTLWSAWLGFGLFNAFLGALLPALGLSAAGIVPAQMRPHVGALAGILVFGVGGPVALLLFGGIERRFGIAGALLALAVPAFFASLMLWRTQRTIVGDLDRMIGDIVDEELLKEEAARGITPALVALRGVDFAYDKLQVLFDVSFSVADGEMVALLGTNGAGKSTLLRVLSGLGYPARGSVRFRGQDITFLDATRRVALGISQIPGGKAVFRSMSVVENLRAYGFTLVRDRKAVDAGIERAFAIFPRLAERRNQLAGTMSGGEAQMLALSKALLLRPRLLCIDELSLGLAPKVVAELLGMVREINAAGTAVVLVEQSVNIALSLVDHAYFMEKGAIAFDGPAPKLLERRDLLRSVFLEGAAAGVGTARS